MLCCRARDSNTSIVEDRMRENCSGVRIGTGGPTDESVGNIVMWRGLFCRIVKVSEPERRRWKNGEKITNEDARAGLSRLDRQ